MRKLIVFLVTMVFFIHSYSQNIEYLCRGVQQIRRTFDVPSTCNIIVKTTKLNGSIQYDTIVGNEITIYEDSNDIRYDITVSYSNVCQDILRIFYRPVDIPTITVQANQLSAYFDETHYGYRIMLSKDNYIIQQWWSPIDSIYINNLSSGNYDLYIANSTNINVCQTRIPITIP